jgi:putative NADPH-quinone reductase
MHIMAVIDHPWERSFNHALLTAVLKGAQQGGHTVDVLDLHQDQFDPVMRVEELAIYTKGTYLDPKVGEYQRRIDQANHLVFIFPVWWEVMPAMLKGFFDKVFLPEWAFAEVDAAPKLTTISGATVITTMGAPRPIHTSVETALCKGTLEFCGIRKTQWFNYCQVGLVSLEQRQAWLAEIEEYTAHLNSD